MSGSTSTFFSLYTSQLWREQRPLASSSTIFAFTFAAFFSVIIRLLSTEQVLCIYILNNPRLLIFLALARPVTFPGNIFCFNRFFHIHPLGIINSALLGIGHYDTIQRISIVLPTAEPYSFQRFQILGWLPFFLILFSLLLFSKIYTPPNAVAMSPHFGTA